jgi:hypothetical protein
VAVVPSGTLPKFRDAGVMLNCAGGGGVAVVPVPVKGMFSSNPGPATKTLPAAMPADCGVNVTFNVTLFPAARVIGKLGALTENSLPTVWKVEIVLPQGRMFVTTTDFVELVPTATEPNERLAGLRVRGSLFTPIP